MEDILLSITLSSISSCTMYLCFLKRMNNFKTSTLLVLSNLLSFLFFPPICLPENPLTPQPQNLPPQNFIKLFLIQTYQDQQRLKGRAFYGDTNPILLKTVHGITQGYNLHDKPLCRNVNHLQHPFRSTAHCFC